MLPDVGSSPSRFDGANGAALPSLHLGPFRPRAGVLTARALDAAALYDPRAERYVTLNPVATRIWELLDGGLSAPAITARVCAEFDAPCEQVSHDVVAQINAFFKDGLIEVRLSSDVQDSGPTGAQERTLPSESASDFCAPSTSVGIRVPSIPSSALMLATIKWLLWARRFEATLAWLRAKTMPFPVTDAAELSVVRTMEYAVAMAGALFPGRARCLEQSLALYYFARRQGVGVRYCQGMQLYPFEAHAWIEYQGEVINDVPEHVKHFTKFPDQLP